jgi:hypothetical protein
MVFRYTLVADGSSDRCLLPIIDAVINEIQLIAEMGVIRQFVPPSASVHGLSDRARAAFRDYPCDVLFVHRDAEREPMETRILEIDQALAGVNGTSFVPIVPIRMTEAWLLIEERAIRRAADNPNGTVGLVLPRIGEIENLPDPKQRLFDLLISASEKNGRRLQQFRSSIQTRRTRVADLIDDFTPLLQLRAFSAFREKSHQV